MNLDATVILCGGQFGKPRYRAGVQMRKTRNLGNKKAPEGACGGVREDRSYITETINPIAAEAIIPTETAYMIFLACIHDQTHQ